MDSIKIKREIEAVLINCGVEESNLGCKDFVKAGIMDSLMVADIVITIEDKFGIEIDGEDISPDWFINVSSIERLIYKYIRENRKHAGFN